MLMGSHLTDCETGEGALGPDGGAPSGTRGARVLPVQQCNAHE